MNKGENNENIWIGYWILFIMILCWVGGGIFRIW